MEFVLYTDISNSTPKVLFYVHDAQHFYRADGDWDGDDRRIYFTTTDRGNTNSDTSFNLFTSDYPYGGGPSEFDRNLGNHDGFLLVGRYIFAQRTDSNGVVALYVSDRRQPFKKAMIPLPDDHERYMYRLTHGFRRYTGNIPEVLISTARGRSPRAVLISTEGISLYTSKAMC